MREALIGHTGFVGGNIKQQHEFTDYFNSNNYLEMQGESFDSVVCAGVKAVKWWSNQNPEQDLEHINDLLSIIKTINTKEFVLISTIDVYPVIQNVDETFDCHAIDNHAYGRNRLLFEDEIKNFFEKVFILRLPALFGDGLKKNVIFDLLNNNCLNIINPNSSFQWYDVSDLWTDLTNIRNNDIQLINLVTEPITTDKITEAFFAHQTYGKEAGKEIRYDLRTCHSASFGNDKGYIRDSPYIFSKLKNFIEAYK